MFGLFGKNKKKTSNEKLQKEEVSFEPANLDFDQIKQMIESPKQEFSMSTFEQSNLQLQEPPLPQQAPQQPTLPPLPQEPAPFENRMELSKPEDKKVEIPRVEKRVEAPKFEEPKEEFRIERKEKPEIYIKIDKYEEVLALLDSLTLGIKEVENVLNKLDEIRKMEEERIKEWKKKIDEIREKINKVIEDLKGE